MQKLTTEQINARNNVAVGLRNTMLTMTVNDLLSIFETGEDSDISTGRRTEVLCVPCQANVMELDYTRNPQLVTNLVETEAVCGICYRTASQVFIAIQKEVEEARERIASRARFGLIQRVAPLFIMRALRPGETSSRMPHGLYFVDWLGGGLMSSFFRPRSVEAALWTFQEGTLNHLAQRYADILKAIADGVTCPACGADLNDFRAGFTPGCFDMRGCGKDRHERAERDAQAAPNVLTGFKAVQEAAEASLARGVQKD